MAVQRKSAGDQPSLTNRLAPSGRSVLVGLALFALAVAGYLGARQTSVFAVRTIDVRGGSPQLQADVRAALGDERGKSLLRVDGSGIERRLASLSQVQSFRFDRSFPHTLHLVIRPERPVLVVRRVPGKDAYLVAASGRVLRTLAHPRLSALPRLWVSHGAPFVVGRPAPAETTEGATALAALRGAPLPGGVRVVRVSGKELTLVLGGGLEVRLGDSGDLRLKLAIARRILRATGAATAGPGYLDVSVPERPVLAQNSQVGG